MLLFLRFSMDHMYDVVANVDDYKHFVPWCRNSKITETKPGHMRAVLEVGFPPLIERYTSILTVARPNLVKVGLYMIVFNSILLHAI